jgi:D-glycero-D-manno-heptose 1,7-bisphosphate phosphatase
MTKKKAVFLDRDGVLNREIGDYVFLHVHLEIPAGVPEGLKMLREAGYLLIMITNQGGIDRGMFTRDEMNIIHDLIQEGSGVYLDDIFYSPHHKSVTNSLLSKPGSLMVQRAIALYDIDPAQSFMIGDAARDIECAAGAGVAPILLPTLKERVHEKAVFVAHDFLDAVNFILKHEKVMA